ncbi:hypothetical protein FRB94_007603 [Tulasnella sp. JGI-2019a]|nr:hypothetical protein FRB94_007603 [Tulasnella sp. JGI-2019a]KAG9008691.1 hypothetical protein FRB93_006237 [Tulasnella sp. JGI-2019a]KAG9032421.1 hypothetical protein FRB95_001474 [Tulasnella sp. JGI-2019a]
MEIIVNHACHDLGDEDQGAVEGAYPPAHPAPLPANGGLAREDQLAMSMCVMQAANGQERTFLHLKTIVAQAGWKPVKVYGGGLDGTARKIIEFTKG